jgi:leader peptidase (prepilin peptidase) / N-methyltransferase
VTPGAALAMAAVLGLIAGSFIATLVLRWETGRSIHGRSSCDGCGRTLGLVDLIPLIGWLVRRGHCPACGGTIDPLHLRVELASAAIGVISIALIPGVGGWCLALLGWMLLPIALLDARHFWLPDALTGTLAVTGLVLAGPLLDTAITVRLIGAAAGGLTLALVAALFLRLRGREGMGGGDPKLMAAIGCWLGWMPLPLVLLLASGGGILWALTTRKRDAALGDRHIPFGTFLAGAAWLAVPLWLELTAR